MSMDVYAFVAAFIAQIPEWATPLTNLGVAGVLLAWFMFTATPLLRSIERSQDLTTRAVLLLAVGLEEAGSETKRQARELLTKLEDKERMRNKDAP